MQLQLHSSGGSVTFGNFLRQGYRPNAILHSPLHSWLSFWPWLPIRGEFHPSPPKGNVPLGLPFWFRARKRKERDGLLSEFAAEAIHTVTIYRDSVAQPKPATGAILSRLLSLLQFSSSWPPRTSGKKSNVKNRASSPQFLHLHRNSPVESFPMTSQQSSWVLCLATSSMVYSFSALGAMVCLFACCW